MTFSIPDLGRNGKSYAKFSIKIQAEFLWKVTNKQHPRAGQTFVKNCLMNMPE